MRYVIEVRRSRLSVTQGFATVCVNGTEMVTFGDQIELIKPGQHWYGDKIGGWASTTPDESFIKGMLFHPFEEFYRHSKKFRDMLDAEIKRQEVTR